MSSPRACAVLDALTPGRRAELYQALAEAVAEPPAWLAEPGGAWPLAGPAQTLAAAGADSTGAAALAAVPAEPLAARRARYAALFTGGRPRIWLYESAFRSGRPFGPEMTAAARLYRAAGLESASAELPDHAAVELAFLAALAEAGWAEWEQRFLADHAGRWLPQLGQALAASGDAVYAPIGGLLAAAFTPAPRQPVGPAPRPRIGVPVLERPEACSLCSFCARVCPTHALAIQETNAETRLTLAAEACTGCGKCIRICPEHTLSLAADPGAGPVLRRSPRRTCPGCGQPAVSEAEFESVAAKVGRPAWLAFCPSCRLQQRQPAASAALEA